jgi:hypothetical protein
VIVVQTKNKLYIATLGRGIIGKAESASTLFLMFQGAPNDSVMTGLQRELFNPLYRYRASSS